MDKKDVEYWQNRLPNDVSRCCNITCQHNNECLRYTNWINSRGSNWVGKYETGESGICKMQIKPQPDGKWKES